MYQRNASAEAAYCRSLAEELEAGPEQALLLRLASEFEILASTATYYACRASQEVTAAVKAQHPKARLAHLTMARRYEVLSHQA